MKRIVSILAVLVLLMCSTAAFASAPTLSHDLPKEVYYGTSEGVFKVKYNGSTYRWLSVYWDEAAGKYEYDNSGMTNGDADLLARYMGDDWLEEHPGEKLPFALLLLGEDFETVTLDYTWTKYTDENGNDYALLEIGGGLSAKIKITYDEDGNPVPVRRYKWQLNNIRSVGPRFRDITPELTDKWFRFTPVDLSEDGLQIFDMISGDHYLVGTVSVLVNGDAVKVSYKYNIPNVTEEDDYTYFTFFSDYDSVTTVEPEEIENRFEYDVEYSIANDLGGDTDVLLYMCNKAMHTDEYTENFMSYRSEWIELINSMLEQIGKTMVE